MLHHLALRGSVPARFANRLDAGRRLLALVQEQPNLDIAVVLAIPRGGLSVAAPIAEGLQRPLDVLIARKVGDQAQPELAIGAVTRFGAVWNQELLDLIQLPAERVEQVRQSATAELERREAAYRGVVAAQPVQRRRVLLVDDGLATGATMAAAVQALQRVGAARTIVAVPVASEEAVERIKRLGASVIALSVPRDFAAVGSFYDDFRPVPDAECIEILRRAATRPNECSGGSTC